MANRKRGYYSIKLGGKSRTLHFSMNFWANFTEVLGIPLDKIGQIFEKGISIGQIRALVYSAILAYDQENGNEIDYNEFTVGAWLEDLGAEDLESIISAMLESKILGNDLNVGIKRNVSKSTKDVGKQTRP
jgi:hypothetical protein